MQFKTILPSRNCTASSLQLGIVLILTASQVCEGSEESASYKTHSNLLYRSEAELTPYMKEQCRLDIYAPENKKEFATVLWFHGGGLTGGKRSIPKQLKEQGVCIIPVSYRLSPKVHVRDCIDDAAAAVAWTFKNIEKYGGDKSKIYVSGHSAGGYLTSMVGLDKRWLSRYGIDANSIAGLIPFSGHTITHFTARAEKGIDGKQPIIDELAPLYHIRKDVPPMLLITGDRELEILGRYEENAYFWRMMQVIKHPDTQLFELDGFNHGEMPVPAYPLLLKFVKAHSKEAK